MKVFILSGKSKKLSTAYTRGWTNKWKWKISNHHFASFHL